ncbi:LD-carboxypeptidase [Microlunatus sp. Gsoil 973]|uniref:S66 peptidase family protein n=1 Tax=Microlunatus sp. Gsoil 973 TaxID=2672569 RepID=UPI0012B4E381|nr:LD-carboxypeptidase [Microlunatus sp. Gsoil 973]QGN33668.1 LD-carboxypeptidase [Microlunatus sp. Gsoil 973]
MEQRSWPEALGPGSVVGLVAPSGPLPTDRIALGIKTLESWGFTVRPGDHLHDQHARLNYLAGTDDDRAADLQAAWTDPQVSAVWCARGGYGAQRMVDLLDFDALRAAGPKHLIGFSDITALHARIGRELGQVTIHGPVGTGTQLADGPSVEALRSLILCRPVPGTELVTGTTLVGGTASGRLIGGNLALIADDLGVEPLPDHGSVVIIEDVGEEAYRLDRMLTQLRRSGWFSMITGVVLGDFTESDDPDLVQAVLTDRLADLGVPILTGAPFGHGDRNLALPLGAEVVLDASAGVLRLAD